MCAREVPAILNEAVPATSQNIESEMQETQRTVHKYTGKLTIWCILTNELNAYACLPNSYNVAMLCDT